MKFLNIETKWLVLLAIGAGTFMSALDASIVNAILPVITDFFHTGVASIEWVVTTSLLVVSGLLLSAGCLGLLPHLLRHYRSPPVDPIWTHCDQDSCCRYHHQKERAYGSLWNETRLVYEDACYHLREEGNLHFAS
ncbi:MAG: hypothetical protein PHP44_01905 [Kiritimatiellae bacterium]|nr:hypothetical protein [Kiritimatiellia bacterium]MDD4734841.1 hypothetical protein [Kiritimatiellia bacterium]